MAGLRGASPEGPGNATCSYLTHWGHPSPQPLQDPQYRRNSLALPYLGSSAGLTTKDQGEENFSKSLSKSEA